MRSRAWRTDNRSRHRGERGQAMVEVALLLPFVVILLLMVIEFGFMMWSHLNVNAAAREAARFAAVGHLIGDEDDCEDGTVGGRARAASVYRVQCASVGVTYRERSGDRIIGRGDEVVVRIDQPYEGLTPLINMMAAFGMGGPSGAITLHACADARLELKYPDQGDSRLQVAAMSCNS